jgi:hypothetical protein
MRLRHHNSSLLQPTLNTISDNIPVCVNNSLNQLWSGEQDFSYQCGNIFFLFDIMSRKLQEWPVPYIEQTKGSFPMGKTK